MSMTTRTLTTRGPRRGQSRDEWRSEWAATVDQFIPFQASALSGGLSYDTGRLPEPWRTQFIHANVRYVISSYATPIAWFEVGKGWVVPDVKYSPTTSQHQGHVRWVLNGENLL